MGGDEGAETTSNMRSRMGAFPEEAALDLHAAEELAAGRYGRQVVSKGKAGDNVGNIVGTTKTNDPSVITGDCQLGLM